MSINTDNASWTDFLDWLTELCDLEWCVSGRVVVIGTAGEIGEHPRLQHFSVGPLQVAVGGLPPGGYTFPPLPPREETDLAPSIAARLRSEIDPETWDEDGTSLEPLGDDVLVVHARRSTLAKIGVWLDARRQRPSSEKQP